jgi:hydroxysqualene dehydroxylase
MKKILIIGGGFAGLAAGVALAEAGHNVNLLERRPFLGGRAYSFLDTPSGDVIDNGQHLFMGCYHETYRFLRKLGTDNLLQLQERPRVDFLDPEGQSTFQCPPLPPPLHLLSGLLSLRGLSLGDKFRTIQVGNVLRLKNGQIQKKLGNLTVDEWLSKCGQSERIKERFWNVLAIATLNEDPKVAAATLLVKVLQEAFGGTKRDSCMAISRVGLSELYTAQAEEFIKARGGIVQLRMPVAKFLIEGSKCLGVQLINGKIEEADQYISAVPHFAIRPLLPEVLFETVPYFSRWRSLGSSPIVSINIWFDRPITDISFAGLLGSRIQWLFNKEAIFARHSKDLQLISFVISAAHNYTQLSKEQLVDIVLEDLHAILPSSREAKVVRAVVVKEHNATLSATILAEKARPDSRTPIENLLIAGDWTNTGLPATIEGAVLSGNRCASIVNEI